MKKQVYFATLVGDGHPIKIGCSENIAGRLDSLSYWAPYPMRLLLAVPGGFKDEAAVHAHFASYLIHREWFHNTPEILEFIARLRGGAAISDFLDTRTPRKMPHKWTDGVRLRHSYKLRLVHAEKKQGFRAEFTRDVWAIMSRWDGGIGRDSQHPSADELARLDEVLSDPRAHITFPAEQSEASA